MEDKIRFGILGCGVIGVTHAEAIAAQPEAELVAVADVSFARAKALAARTGATPYPSLEAMLAGAPLDVVDICTPSGLHGAQAVQVMRSGRHAIVEKPMELTREAVTAMRRAQEETGTHLAVISQHRFDPAAVQVHALIAEGALGRLVLGNAVVPWWRAQSYYDSGGWRGTAALDGGVLMNQAIHSIDVLQWLMGPVKSVAAYTTTRAHRMEMEDAAVAALRFANGALGTLAATTGAYPGAPTRIEVYGDQGSAVIENDQLKWVHLAREEAESAGPYGINGGPGTPGTPITVPAGPPLPAGHGAQVADMIRAIREGRAPAVDGSGGAEPVEIILAVEELARTGCEVVLR